MGAALSKSRRKRRSSLVTTAPAYNAELFELPLPPPKLEDILPEPLEASNRPNNPLELTNCESTTVRNVSLVFNEEDLDISGRDLFSTSTMDLVSIIFSFLSPEDICTVQKVSRLWWKTLEANDIWKVIVRREAKNWTAKVHEYVLKCIRAEVESGDFVRWKELLKDYYRNRDCCKCGRLYKQCFNTPAACVRHSGIRDLVEDRGIPSGVYWLCCLEKQKSAVGCTVGGHEEKRPNNTNFNNNDPFSRYRRVR